LDKFFNPSERRRGGRLMSNSLKMGGIFSFLVILPYLLIGWSLMAGRKQNVLGIPLSQRGKK
jgi:hypothetical protein